ncbi:8622_t:CDS:2 [Ambispora gerdemannii]|uniref:8622_t:CDS:1 n=1 Tax=Ambispora gerdemannii TaxID=144530 RepID=A0A9N9CAM0_9GLOM|nr:8622_t:CDS:2 [Ambispora gerdemannii]
MSSKARDILNSIIYWVIRLFAKLIFHVFYRDHGALYPERFPKDDGTPVLLVAAPHGNFLMDAITIFVTCPRNHYFLSAKSNFSYPIFGWLITLLGAIPVTRPQDVERINGDGLIKVLEEGKIVEGENLGKTVQVGDSLYVEFEGPDDNDDMLKEACGTVEEIINEHRVRIKEPGMKWLTKGRRKNKLKRLVAYGSLVVRVERGNTLKTLEGLSLIPKVVSKGIDRLSTSPGRIAFPIQESSDFIGVQSPPKWLVANERTPLMMGSGGIGAGSSSSSSQRSQHARQLSNSSTISNRQPPIPNFPSVPSIPTTFSYTHMPPHSEVYSAVYNIFSRSRCVAIFPEGTSHDNDHMLSLKYGCAVMALGYLASKEPDSFGNKRTLKIVPCGVNFFNRHRFRSRVFVDVGNTIEVEERLVEMYRQGACQELLKTIHSSLLEITVNAPDYDTLLFFKTASRMYRDKLSNLLDFAEKLALLRRIAKKYSSTTPPTDEARRLKRDIVSYAQTLRSKRLSPPHMHTSPFSLFFFLPLFLFLFILMTPGFIFFSPIGFVAYYVGKKQGENAMLYDDNSLAITRWPGRDVIATWKMLVGTALFVTFDITYTALTVHYIHKHGVFDLHGSREYALAVVLCFFVVWPLIAYGTILTWERMCWVGKHVWVGLWGVARPRQRRDFLLWREQLSQRVVRWVDGTTVAP